MKKLEKWILLMDGIKAKILKKEASGNYVHVYGTEHIEEFNHQNIVASHQAGSSTQHGGGHEGHHVFPREENAKELDKERFVKKIVSFLNENKSLYDKLVVVAPDRILGYLRAAFNKEITEKVYQEIRKDLMHVPVSELHAHLT
ncbi:MAG: host attachment protein [Candidatus Paracaedibacteraceae bacterium]|nr:host attachment protein [Candidatus Paracaedibacteraceae bacterium]